ncbi:hypothetical protein BD413DRAFT_579701 [Trametes elegans]|nr:hypothetical protein BD413DRAFT_596989 [Trametes elegans]KAI0764057.1 hypothetical protein BD413DRAFT_579701 [Trametes elegans]
MRARIVSCLLMGSLTCVSGRGQPGFEGLHERKTRTSAMVRIWILERPKQAVEGPETRTTAWTSGRCEADAPHREHAPSALQTW